MRPHSAKGKTFLILSDLGPSAELLNNTEHMRNSAQALMKRGIVPVENGWAGWLGKYEARLVHSFEELNPAACLEP